MRVNYKLFGILASALVGLTSLSHAASPVEGYMYGVVKTTYNTYNNGGDIYDGSAQLWHSVGYTDNVDAIDESPLTPALDFGLLKLEGHALTKDGKALDVYDKAAVTAFLKNEKQVDALINSHERLLNATYVEDYSGSKGLWNGEVQVGGGLYAPKAELGANILLSSSYSITNGTHVHSYVKQAYVDKTIGSTTIKYGKLPLILGSGLSYDDSLRGWTVEYNNNSWHGSVSHGTPSTLDFDLILPKLGPEDSNYILRVDGRDLLNSPRLTVFQLKKDWDNLSLATYYAKGLDALPLDWYGLSLQSKYGKWTVLGEFAKARWHKSLSQISTGLTGDSAPENYGQLMDYFSLWDAAYMLSLNYGTYDPHQAKSWSIQAQYVKEGQLAPIFISTWSQPVNQNYKGFIFTGSYVPLKNLGLSTTINWHGETLDNHQLPNTYQLQLNYFF